MIVATDVRAGQSSSLTVLAAEDDAAFRGVIEAWFAGPGYEIRTAADGCEALDLLDDGVDVFLCDRNMPGLDGHEVVDRLDETCFDGPLIVLSAYEPDGDLAEDDVDSYLTKPVDRDEVERAIEAAT